MQFPKREIEAFSTADNSGEIAPLVELGKTFGLHPKGRRFESVKGYNTYRSNEIPLSIA